MADFTQNQTLTESSYSSLPPSDMAQPFSQLQATSRQPITSGPVSTSSPVKAADSSQSRLQSDTNDVSSTTKIEVPEESNVIEKEWVEKVQTIVEKTQKNPYLKSQQISLLKVDYLKKRYGKTLDIDGQK